MTTKQQLTCNVAGIRKDYDKAMLTLGQTVITPNGAGIYQFPLWREGENHIMVSHPVTAEIDPDKCQELYGDGRGIWYLAGYLPGEVKEK